MKKIISLILSMVMLMFLTSCSLDDSPQKEIGNVSSTISNNDTETFNLNETAAFKDLKFTATEIKTDRGNDFFKPENGNIFIGIKFTIENVSDEEQAISSILLFDAYADDVKCDYSLTAACVFDDGTLDGTIAPGKKMVGWYALELSESWGNIELVVKADWLSNGSAKFVFEK